MSDDDTDYTFSPVNKPALKSLLSLPEEASVQFIHALDSIYYGMKPGLIIENLATIGPGVKELKINGSPAYRCVYRHKSSGQIDLLHAFVKTCNGPDRKNMATAKKRYKLL